MRTTAIHRTLPSPRTVFIALACALLGACAAPDVKLDAMVRDWANYMQSDYVLRPNDQLVVNVDPDGPQQTLVVPPTGSMILAELEQPVEAVGRPVRVFRSAVQEAYRKVFRGEVKVQVSLLQTGVSAIYVIGEVRSPGPKPYDPNMTLSQAIAAAGGFAYRAKLTDVRVVRAVPSSKPKTYRVNIHRVFHAEGFPDFLVLPGDVVYCQTNWAGDLADGLRLYIWDLLPFRSLPTLGF